MGRAAQRTCRAGPRQRGVDPDGDLPPPLLAPGAAGVQQRHPQQPPPLAAGPQHHPHLADVHCLAERQHQGGGAAAGGIRGPTGRPHLQQALAGSAHHCACIQVCARHALWCCCSCSCRHCPLPPCHSTVAAYHSRCHCCFCCCCCCCCLRPMLPTTNANATAAATAAPPATATAAAVAVAAARCSLPLVLLPCEYVMHASWPRRSERWERRAAHCAPECGCCSSRSGELLVGLWQQAWMPRFS